MRPILIACSVILARGCRAKRRSVCSVLSASEGTRIPRPFTSFRAAASGRPDLLPVEVLVSGFLTHARHARGNGNQGRTDAEAASLCCARLNKALSPKRRPSILDPITKCGEAE